MPLKASYFTLGCKLNYSETSTIGKLLRERGIENASKNEIPDICVINTCSVTETADKKGRSLIRRLSKKYPQASLIVTGCYAQLKPEEVAKLPGVNLVLGSNEKLKITQYIDSWLSMGNQTINVSQFREISDFMPSCERGDRTRYFLKVQDGCDYFCTYCTIPFARGLSRSGKISDLVSMAQEASFNGGKEIVITGVNIGTFGKDHNEDFFSLIRELDKVETIERFRISSIEPNLLTDEIISWMANESRAFMPHFHIPLQSGSDKVLKMMNRRYDTELFRHRVEKIKELIPNAFIGVDIIAGARGETTEEWEKSLAFAESIDISKFHVFPYSERPGTKALLLGESVPNEERHKRVAILTELSDRKTKKFIEQNLGEIRKVLWERPTDSFFMNGLTDNYIRIEAPLNRDLINSVSEVKLSEFHPKLTESVIGIHTRSL